MARFAPLRTPSSTRASSSAPTLPRVKSGSARRGVAFHASSAASPTGSTRGGLVAGCSAASPRSCSSPLPLSESNVYSSLISDSWQTHQAPFLTFAEPFLVPSSQAAQQLSVSRDRARRWTTRSPPSLSTPGCARTPSTPTRTCRSLRPSCHLLLVRSAVVLIPRTHLPLTPRVNKGY